jgi:hypothetical protein
MAKLPDTPEGLGVDSHGNLYATLMHIGEVVMLKEEGNYDHIARVPSKEESGKGDLIGLDLNQSGNIYVAYTGHSKREFGKSLRMEKAGLVAGAPSTQFVRQALFGIPTGRQ